MADAVDDLLEKDHIIDVITRLFVATDDAEWPVVRECFDESVLFDMTSLAGGAVATLTPDQIVEGWRVGLAPIEHVHHQVGNFAVQRKGDRAKASCYGTAYHYRRTASGRDTRVFVGSYDFELRRVSRSWRVSAFRFNLKFIEGNRELEKGAGA